MKDLAEGDIHLGPEPTEVVKDQARQVAASFANNPGECRMFLEMLGLADLPARTPGYCVCGELLPMAAKLKQSGETGYGGFCASCRREARRG